jgi:hypothetical protein
MSVEQRTDASKPTAWWNTEGGAILLVVLVFCVIIDLGGWLGGQSGLIVFLLAIGEAASESKAIQVSDNSFFTIFSLISLKSASEIGEIVGWRQSAEGFSRRVLAVALLIFVILFVFIGDTILNQTFGSFGYGRCPVEERVGFGKSRYTKIRFARDVMNCPQLADPCAKVE